MARWEPDARQRLVAAALDLFTEQGYDDTTVAQIADRAGLTKSTFFRHFPDKREVLVAGQDTLSRLLTEGIAAAPEPATPLEAVALGLEAAATAFTPERRELAPRLQAVIAANGELQERDALKHVGLAKAIGDALKAAACPTRPPASRPSSASSRCGAPPPAGPTRPTTGRWATSPASPCRSCGRPASPSAYGQSEMRWQSHASESGYR